MYNAEAREVRVSWDNLIFSCTSRHRALYEYFSFKMFWSGKLLQELIWKYQFIIFSVDCRLKWKIIYCPTIFPLFLNNISPNCVLFFFFFWICSFIPWYTTVLNRKISNNYQSNFLIVVSLLTLGCIWDIFTLPTCIHLIYFGFYWVPYQRYLNSTPLIL